MSISDADKEDALQGYIRYSRILDRDDLKRFYEDLDFTDLCNVRDLIADIELTEQEQTLVDQADDRLRETFDEQTLQLYADYFPTLPIRDWWG
jgi:hypothetical protein